MLQSVYKPWFVVKFVLRPCMKRQVYTGPKSHVVYWVSGTESAYETLGSHV